MWFYWIGLVNSFSPYKTSYHTPSLKGQTGVRAQRLNCHSKY